MQTLEIEICNPKAAQLLHDLAQLDLIVIHTEQEDMERRLRRKAGWAKGQREPLRFRPYRINH